MRAPIFTPADALRLALLAALGLPALTACGGTIDAKGDAVGDGGGPSGGTTGVGGTTGDGGTVGSGGDIGSGGFDGTGSARGDCYNETPIMPGYDTGFYRCDQGFEHRKEVRECPSFLPRAEPQPDIGAGGATTNECTYDTDCPGPLGYCVTEYWQPSPEAQHVCRTGCISDSDCQPGTICHCGDPVGTCVATEGPNGSTGCTSDADCEGNLKCAYVPEYSCGSSIHFACQTPNDECDSSEDCTGPGGGSCALSYEGTGQRVCQGAVACGRPFLVDFLERRAEACERGDWTLSARSPRLTELTAETRARLAQHWTDIALMEHASIAAFARFSLQLLSLGAPVELIEATNNALADETKHARLCFALASSYREAPVGPGALDIGGSLESNTPEMILRTVIREGCLGETQAALEAAHALSLCDDYAVKEVLQVIAQDEAQHAELAWRFVHWLLTEKPELRSVARQEFAGAMALLTSPSTERDVSLERYGVLDQAARDGIRNRALASVLAPCAESLLAAFASEPPPASQERAETAVARPMERMSQTGLLEALG